VIIDLVNLRSGRLIDQVSSQNKQISRGEDVISRIVYAERQARGLEELQGMVIETINELLEELAHKHRFSIADGSFMSEFTAALFLPHTDIDNFPSVRALLEKQELNVRG